MLRSQSDKTGSVADNFGGFKSKSMNRIGKRKSLGYSEFIDNKKVSFFESCSNCFSNIYDYLSQSSLFMFHKDNKFRRKLIQLVEGPDSLERIKKHDEEL